MKSEPKREQLAALMHKQWAGWMICLFEKCEPNPGGSVRIPREYVDRWVRQISTAYENLPEEEKESDRKEADRVIDLLFFSEE